MKRSLILLPLLAAGMAVLVLGSSATQEPPGQPPGPAAGADGVEPQTRGPLHEAFAEPTVATPTVAPIVPKQPPDPIEEAPPDEKPAGNNVQWIPGYWTYDDEQADFLWVSGFWRDIPPDRRWVAGYWTQAPDNGWQRVAGYWENVQQTEVQYLPPPPHNIDAGPSIPAPSDQSSYIPGCWVYQSTRFLWRPGHWIGIQQGWVYTPARYYWTPGGYIFCEGHWDYPLESRGLLFCPVRIDIDFLRRPNWVYRPHYCVSTPALLTALFVRPTFGHYYFGDYFATEYNRAGFVPWMNYNVVRNTPNPLFAYYHARQDRDWSNNLRQVYADRSAGRLPAPPASFAQQTRVIQHITQVTNINNNIQINQQNFKVTNKNLMTQQLTMLAPITQVTQVNTNVKLQPVTKQMMVAVQKNVTQIHQVSQARQQFDVKQAQVVAQAEKKGGPPMPIAAKFTLPRPAAIVAPSAEVKTQPHVVPPHPVAPKAVAVKPPAPKAITPPRLEAKPTVIAPKRPETLPHPNFKAAPKTEKGPPAEKAPPKEIKGPAKTEEKPATKPAPPPPPPKETKKLEPPPPPPKDEKKAAPPPPPKVETKPAPPPPPKVETKPAPPPPPKVETKPAPPPPPKDEKKSPPPKSAAFSPPPLLNETAAIHGRKLKARLAAIAFLRLRADEAAFQ